MRRYYWLLLSLRERVVSSIAQPVLTIHGAKCDLTETEELQIPSQRAYQESIMGHRNIATSCKQGCNRTWLH